MRFRLSFILFFLLLLAGTAGGVPPGEAAEKGGFVGKEAPVFRATRADGKPFDLAEHLKDNKYILINFWGLRCSSCIEEMPMLNEAHEKYASRGFLVVGVNVDGVNCETLAAQIKKIGLKMNYTVLADEELKIADLYALGAAPLTYVIGKDGRIIYQHAGFEEGDEEKMVRFLATLFP